MRKDNVLSFNYPIHRMHGQDLYFFFYTIHMSNMSDSAYLKLQYKLIIYLEHEQTKYFHIYPIHRIYGHDLYFLFYPVNRMSNMSDSIHDSAYGEDYESSGSPAGGVTMHKIQKSSR